VVGELLPCRADPALLKQLFVNLLSNALKFTRHRVDSHIEIASSELDGEVVYSITDDGAGFDMKYANKLFGVFQRLHRAEDYEGTGVGLAIAQRIVHRHGGRIWATGVLDHGATFSFSMPDAQTTGGVR
jgi:light-regulated signal transduction histidine kinase (bacteriophytochrome)